MDAVVSCTRQSFLRQTKMCLGVNTNNYLVLFAKIINVELMKHRYDCLIYLQCQRVHFSLAVKALNF